MAGVADESDGPRRQQCIDVLCGYLRLPYSPELGANHQSKLVVKQHRATADNTRADDREPTFDWSTDHSRKPANIEPQDWPPAVAAPNLSAGSASRYQQQ
jgi:hypothetical protein